MKYEEALKKMNEGIRVESVVSETIYEIVNGQLLAEGMAVKEDYIVQEEKDGEFREYVQVYGDSPEEEIKEYVRRSNIYRNFLNKYSEIKNKNIL